MVIAVMGLNASSVLEKPRTLSKSVSMSKNAVCSLGPSEPKKFSAKQRNTGLMSASNVVFPAYILSSLRNSLLLRQLKRPTGSSNILRNLPLGSS